MDNSTRCITPLLVGGVIGATAALIGTNFTHVKQLFSSRKSEQVSNVSKASSVAVDAAIVVLGSANADLYIDLNEIPRPGETVDGSLSVVGPGGKGSNQAGAAAKTLDREYMISQGMSDKIAFIGRVGRDQHRDMFFNEYDRIALDHSLVATHPTEPTGQAYIMLAKDGQNSIIIALGANESAWTLNEAGVAVLSPAECVTISKAKVLLLQREVPDAVNYAAAQVARDAGVPVMLDMGGKAGDVDMAVLPLLDLFSLNETELARVSGQAVPITPIEQAERDTLVALKHCPTFSVAPMVAACGPLFAAGVRRVLVTLGSDGALLIGKQGVEAYHPGFTPETLIDTTGAGDCFRATYAVAFVSNKNPDECLEFASAAATICIGRKGTLPSMPTLPEIHKLLQNK